MLRDRPARQHEPTTSPAPADNHRKTAMTQLPPRRDRGAAAVEMAIVLPVLVAMLFGIIDYGRIFNAEIQLSQATREGVRLASLGYPLSDVKARTKAAASGIAFGAELADSEIAVTACPPTVTATSVAQVQATYLFSSALGWTKNLSQKAVMRCAG
ncbi:MAG TPA: TadE/TadG family type IV pilus assembly protein [Dermatophilaceae bacterium]|nr:TadE/TadG family type IV pilus assembly protein [Dermatophilaceae bacterium]